MCACVRCGKMKRKKKKSQPNQPNTRHNHTQPTQGYLKDTKRWTNKRRKYEDKGKRGAKKNKTRVRKCVLLICMCKDGPGRTKEPSLSKQRKKNAPKETPLSLISSPAQSFARCCSKASEQSTVTPIPSASLRLFFWLSCVYVCFVYVCAWSERLHTCSCKLFFSLRESTRSETLIQHYIRLTQEKLMTTSKKCCF